jgi:hypothetical protein
MEMLRQFCALRPRLEFRPLSLSAAGLLALVSACSTRDTQRTPTTDAGTGGASADASDRDGKVGTGGKPGAGGASAIDGALVRESGSGGSLDGATPVSDAALDGSISASDAANDAGVEHDAAPDSAVMPSLTGATVDWSARYPTTATAISTHLSAVVGPAVEFPNIEDHALSGYYLVGANIDVGSASIEIDYHQALSGVPAATFNGYVFGFSATSPVIKGVSIDAATSSELLGAVLSFGAHAVNVNMTGLTITTQSKLVIDVQL